MTLDLEVNNNLLQEAMALTGSQSEVEVVRLALEELVTRRKRRSLLDLVGKVHLAENFDHKDLRKTRFGPD